MAATAGPAEIMSLRLPGSTTISAHADTTNPVVEWNEMTTDLGLEYKVPPPYFARDYALIHVAMFDALLKAKNNNGNPAQTAIVAGAAAEVLTYLFPDNATQIAELEAAHLSSIQGYNKGQINSGSNIGHNVGKKVVAYAKTDGSDAIWDGSMPTGDGIWTGNNPVAPLFGYQKTYILTSGFEFQPSAPYSYGSPADMADVQAVIDAANERTPEQIEAVHEWADLPPPTIWNGYLNERIISYGLSIYEAARASAYLNTGMYDSFVSCWASKYTYWTARPFQRISDPTFTTVIQTPNFPSYTSGHSTISATAAMILGQIFPDEASHFLEESVEAKNSRLWGGIHFPQDNEKGFQIGEQIGNKYVNDMIGPAHPFVLGQK